MPKFDEIDIEKIILGEPNVRKIDVDLGIDDLARSIKEQGLLQPVIVRKLEDGFELIAGQRRLSALTKLKETKVPAMIVDTADPNTMMLISLIENEMSDRRVEFADLEHITGYVDDLKKVLDSGLISERKSFIRSFVKEVKVTDSEVVLSYTMPLVSEKMPMDIEEVLPIVQYGGR